MANYPRVQCEYCGRDQPRWQAIIREGKLFCAINCYVKWLAAQGRYIQE